MVISARTPVGDVGRRTELIPELPRRELLQCGYASPNSDNTEEPIRASKGLVCALSRLVKPKSHTLFVVGLGRGKQIFGIFVFTAWPRGAGPPDYRDFPPGTGT